MISKEFDLIIIGGGISGVYLLYNLSKSQPNLRILLLEKYNSFGGRVSTFHENNKVYYEEGAGRFSNKHKLLMKLIKDLGLKENIIHIDKKLKYIEEYNKFQDHPPYQDLFKILKERSKKIDKSILQNETFEKFAINEIGKEKMKIIKDSFGYLTELIIMNAYDALNLFEELNVSNFYVLGGGLSLLIEKMILEIDKNKNILMSNNNEIKDISILKDNSFQVKNTLGKIYSANKVVCALPKTILEKLKIFNPIKSTLLNKVYCGSLCRIYWYYENENDNIFKDSTKFYTKNKIRIVIPISNNSIMISYTDNKYAKGVISSSRSRSKT